MLEGSVTIAGASANESEAALLTMGKKVEVIAEQKAGFVLKGGKSHGEPVIPKGSFVYQCVLSFRSIGWSKTRV